jgi:hypothetical protein
MAYTIVLPKFGPPTLGPSSLPSIGKPVYLELCVKSGPGTTRLAEITIVDGMGQELITTDLELFASIRKAYNSTKREGPFKIFAFLFRPDDIHFVEFAMLHRRAIIFGSPPTPSLPPDIEVDEKHYHYSGYYSTERLPMHRDVFCQYYRQRQNFDPQSAVFLNRLPKKLGTSMTVLADKNPREFKCGWGMHIVEGPNKPVLAALVTSFLVLGVVFFASLNAYLGISGRPFMGGLWLGIALAWALFALYVHIEDW